MAILKYFIMCDSVFDKNGKMSIDGIFDSITAVNFPSHHPNSSMVLGFVNGLGEYVVQVEIVAPDNKSIFNSGNMKMKLNDRNHISNLVFNLQNLPLAIPGIYHTTIKVDGHEIAKYPLTVNQPEIKENITRDDLLNIIGENTVKAELECPKCKALTGFVISKNKDLLNEIDVPMPNDDEVVCPKCNEFTFNLGSVKRHLLFAAKNTIMKKDLNKG